MYTLSPSLFLSFFILLLSFFSSSTILTALIIIIIISITSVPSSPFELVSSPFSLSPGLSDSNGQMVALLWLFQFTVVFTVTVVAAAEMVTVTLVHGMCCH